MTDIERRAYALYLMARPGAEGSARVDQSRVSGEELTVDALNPVWVLPVVFHPRSQANGWIEIG